MRNPARTSSSSTLARSSAAAHSTRRSNETALLWALLPLRPFYPHTAMRRGPLGAHSRGASPLPPPPRLPTPLPPIPPASSPLTSSPPARPLAVAGPERPGKLLRPRQRLRTPAGAGLGARVSASGHSGTAIFVAWRKSAPFWARNSVGIVSLEVHRLAFAASAENL